MRSKKLLRQSSPQLAFISMEPLMSLNGQQSRFNRFFITNGPVYGLPASSKTEVRVLYDNTAIYIGAYLYDDPAAVRRQFTARDNEQRSDVDYFSVFLRYLQ